jgi:hypothetical protein
MPVVYPWLIPRPRQVLRLAENFPDVLSASRESLDDIASEIAALLKEVNAAGSLVKDQNVRRGKTFRGRVSGPLATIHPSTSPLHPPTVHPPSRRPISLVAL